MEIKKMKSAGAIIFYQDKGKINYLLLKHKKTDSHWGFAKGRVEERETENETALREIREETGISQIKIIKGFKEIEKYSFLREDRKIDKQVIYFLGEVSSKEASVSEEHSDFLWLDFEQAIEKIKNKETRKVLIKANKYLKCLQK